MHHFMASLPKWILTPPKETSSHIFKMVIFPKFFWAFMKHIIRWNTGKKIKLFHELFTNTIFEYSFVCFFTHKTIVLQLLAVGLVRYVHTIGSKTLWSSFIISILKLLNSATYTVLHMFRQVLLWGRKLIFIGMKMKKKMLHSNKK